MSDIRWCNWGEQCNWLFEVSEDALFITSFKSKMHVKKCNFSVEFSYFYKKLKIAYFLREIGKMCGFSTKNDGMTC